MALLGLLALGRGRCGLRGDLLGRGDWLLVAKQRGLSMGREMAAASAI